MRREPASVTFAWTAKPFMTTPNWIWPALLTWSHQHRTIGRLMSARSSLTVVLAAGEGTRMQSSQPKVLHPIAAQPLLSHVLRAIPHGDGAGLAVVVGPNHRAVEDEVKRLRPDAATFVQHE